MKWTTVQLHDHRFLAELLEANGALAGSCKWIFASARIYQIRRRALKGRRLAEAAFRRLLRLLLLLLVISLSAVFVIIRAEVATEDEAIPLMAAVSQLLITFWLPPAAGAQRLA